MDGAFTIRSLNGGREFTVGIHIVDVSQFVEIGDLIDNDAKRRTTSFYPATESKVYHMLPERLSTYIVSLKEGKDRHVLSLFLNIDHGGNIGVVQNPKRAIIRNDHELTYKEAQDIINTAKYKPPEISNSLESSVFNMHLLAEKIRSKRIKEGQHFFPER